MLSSCYYSTLEDRHNHIRVQYPISAILPLVVVAAIVILDAADVSLRLCFGDYYMKVQCYCSDEKAQPIIWTFPSKL